MDNRLRNVVRSQKIAPPYRSVEPSTSTSHPICLYSRSIEELKLPIIVSMPARIATSNEPTIKAVEFKSS